MKHTSTHVFSLDYPGWQTKIKTRSSLNPKPKSGPQACDGSHGYGGRELSKLPAMAKDPPQGGQRVHVQRHPSYFPNSTRAQFEAKIPRKHLTTAMVDQGI